MAHIVEFTINGLAGRSKPYSQELNRDVNIFFGLNGSGKTSLLKILHSAMRRNELIVENVPFERAEVKIYSEEYKKVYTHTINKTGSDERNLILLDPESYQLDIDEELSLHDHNRLVRRTKKLEWKITPKKDNRGWMHRYLPVSRLWNAPVSSLSPRESADSSLIEEKLDGSFANTLNALWSAYVQGILGNVRIAQAEGLANILTRIVATTTSKKTEQILPADIAFKRAKSFLARQGTEKAMGSTKAFEKKYSEDKILQSVVGYIDDVESRIEEVTEPRDRLQGLIGKMFGQEKKAIFSDKSIDISTSKDEPISLARLSSGEKQVLRILVDCLHAAESTIMIDEPEISMHVDWQRYLVSAMKSINPGAQLILATHSPEIMADVDDNKIFRI